MKEGPLIHACMFAHPSFRTLYPSIVELPIRSYKASISLVMVNWGIEWCVYNYHNMCWYCVKVKHGSFSAVECIWLMRTVEPLTKDSPHYRHLHNEDKRLQFRIIFPLAYHTWQPPYSGNLPTQNYGLRNHAPTDKIPSESGYIVTCKIDLLCKRIEK